MEPSIDVATPNQNKLKALGFVWIASALFILAIINGLIYDSLFSETPLWKSDSIIAILGSILMPLLFWFSVANAAHRFSTSRMISRYFRVSPNGISICISKNDSKAIYLFSHGSHRIDLTWDRITKWYPYRLTINGIPAAKTIVFETTDGKKIEIPTYNFAEKQNQIVDNIRDAISTIRRLQITPREDHQTYAEIGAGR